MPKRIVIIQGHPDTHTHHFGHALADEFAKGAEDSGYEVIRHSSRYDHAAASKYDHFAEKATTNFAPEWV